MTLAFPSIVSLTQSSQKKTRSQVAKQSVHAKQLFSEVKPLTALYHCEHDFLSLINKLFFSSAFCC